MGPRTGEPSMTRKTRVAEGKTKIVWADEESEALVYVESKDDITAGDGAKRDIIENKRVLATTTTSNCFKLLNQHGIPTHFIKQVDERTFWAKRVEMIPLELVVRRVATGSYLKRRPDVMEGTVLPYPVEFFVKDDANHDPLIIHDFASERFLFYNPKKPMKEGFLEERPMAEGDAEKWLKVIPDLRRYAYLTFRALEEAWRELGVTLIDLKIECGWAPGSQLVVADVIDNDSWRIWPGGNKAEMKDKEVYRGLAESTPDALGAIKKNYTWVAEQTGKFVS